MTGSKQLLIIATGACAWDDLAKVKKATYGFDTMAVNHMIMYYPNQLDYAVSWHSDAIEYFVKVRTYRKQKNKPITHSPKPKNGVDVADRHTTESVQTSGMYAVYAGLHLGYDKIVLAGLPFDESGYFYNQEKSKHIYRRSAEKDWKTIRGISGNRVRAVSGNLIKCFGEVTKEWLES